MHLFYLYSLLMHFYFLPNLPAHHNVQYKAFSQSGRAKQDTCTQTAQEILGSWLPDHSTVAAVWHLSTARKLYKQIKYKSIYFHLGKMHSII